jgi:hypothetical protein
MINKMRTIFVCFITIVSSFLGKAQECTCPVGINNDNDGKPSRIFHFSNGKELGICGYTAPELDTSYNQFTLFECGTGKAIEVWDVNKTCQAQMVKDELFLKEMYGLPIGQNFSTIWRPFLIHKFSYKNEAVHEDEYYRKDLGKYSKDQLNQIFAEYKKLPEGGKENMMHVANMLFYASFCGNKEAEADLNSMPAKFGPFDGVIGEEWKGIYGNYEKWKLKSGGK